MKNKFQYSVITFMANTGSVEHTAVQRLAKMPEDAERADVAKMAAKYIKLTGCADVMWYRNHVEISEEVFNVMSDHLSVLEPDEDGDMSFSTDDLGAHDA